MININLSNQEIKSVSQKFSFFSEKQWEAQKDNFKGQLKSLFSAQKDETFILF